MACLQNSKAVITVLSLTFLLVACLTPEERSEVYGGEKPVESVKSMQGDAAEVSANTTYQPPKAAPTTAVTTRHIEPIAGLRRSATGTDGGLKKPIMSRQDCGVDDFSYLQGQALASLSSIQFNQPIRIIMPEQGPPRGFNRNRLNFEITTQGVIGRLWCG